MDGIGGGIVTILTTIYVPQPTGSGNGGGLTNGTYISVATRTVTLSVPIASEVSGGEVFARINILMGWLVAISIGFASVA